MKRRAGVERPLERPITDGATRVRNDGLNAEAARAYAVAYAAHYSERDLATALELYRNLIASHASAPEARYSRAQIQNIVKTLVPAQELLDAQMELALAQLDRV